MSKTKGFLLAVAVAAMAFTFSCSSGDDSGGSGGGDPSSSSGGTQGGGGSSSSGGGGGNACTDLEPIIIGSQTWAKKNLDCDVAGSKCYDDDPDNCETYGRLYDWATAKTACPSGWHLPSDAEWGVLVNHAGGMDIAGGKLKATSGWNENGNGTDEYGFSAKPGGEGSSDGSFARVGERGFWWSATEYNSEDGDCWRMYYNTTSLTESGCGRSRLLSVRCIKD